MKIFPEFNETKTESGAIFSECGRYRFKLWRRWNLDLPDIMFVGLNPSTADAMLDDPTIRKVVKYARRWGFGGVQMLNLFPCCSTAPRGIWEGEQETNIEHLRAAGAQCAKVVFAWGADKAAVGCAADVVAMFPEAWCLKICNHGAPGHPLYLRDSLDLMPYTKQ